MAARPLEAAETASTGQVAPSIATPDAGEPSPSGAVAGYLFGVAVPLDNYEFAKRVSYLFPRPGQERLTGADRERAIWEALILHYESFREGVTVSEEELERRINGVLRDEKQSFTRSGDPAAYAKWVQERIGEDTPLFENQMRYLLQVDKLKDTIRDSRVVTVTEDEMRQEFLNEKNHVGGEIALFGTREEADAFYQQVKAPGAWDKRKAEQPERIRPFSTITLEAIMVLWGVPKDQIYAFHAMELGSVGPPMPFGPNQWGVLRLLDKRTGDLADFPKERDAYSAQLRQRKQYEALNQWVEDLKASAQLKVLPILSQPRGEPASR